MSVISLSETYNAKFPSLAVKTCGHQETYS